MKVLNLRCAHDHRFEGWFSSEQAFHDQSQSGQLLCPLCGDSHIQRLPSAPRLNLRSQAPVKSSSPPTDAESASMPVAPSEGVSVTNAVDSPAQLQALWLQAVHHVIANTQDVGEQFPEEARRMHYGEEPHRPIRGHASPDEVAALREEGIELASLPIPAALKGPVQ